MSCKTETKYLTIKFLYSSRILNIQTGIIVCASDKIKNLYNEITAKLLINHKDKDHKKFFHLFCNSKLCSNMMDKSFKDIFGITPYVINIILRREFFDINNLIKKPTKISRNVKKRAYRKVHKSVNTVGVEEISSYEFIEDLQKNESINYKREINFKLFKVFFKLRLREDIILIDILKKFNKSKLSNGIDIKSDFPDLIHLTNLELNSPKVIKRPIILYYQSLFSVEQLKSALSQKDNKLIESYLNGIEKFGINTNHSGCLAEQELRKILTNDKSLEIFIKFIETNNYDILLHSLSLYQKYAKITSVESEKKLLKSTTHSDYRKIVNQPIKVQSGGSIEKFNNLRRLLEIQGEPKHDFGKGDRAELPENVDRNFFGKDTDELREFNDLSRHISKDIGHNVVSGLFLGSHESKYFLNFFKNMDYHIQRDIRDINSRFRFFRFKDQLKLEMNVYQDDIKGISHDMENSSSVSGIKYLKSTLINDNINHFLFDTSASISGTSCFKDCLIGRTFTKDCKRAGDSEREREQSSRICKTGEAADISEIVPIVKFWDPAPFDFSKFSETIKELQDSRDASYIKMMTSLFMNNFDSDDEFSPPTGFDEIDNVWYPRRDTLSDDYKVKFNSNIIEQIRREETPDMNNLIIKLKNVEDDILIKEGFSVKQLSKIIRLLMDKGTTPASLEAILRKPKYAVFKNITIHLFEAIKNKSLTRQQVLKILLDMKKSGDWSLIKWTQINNKYFRDNHKTILYTGDVLCGLFSIVNDVPTLFGTTSIDNYNPFKYINGVGELEFIENRSLAYYSGNDKDFTYNDFLQKHNYISDNLFEIGSERLDDGEPKEVVDLSDPEMNWDDSDLIKIKEKLSKLIIEMEKTPDSLSYIFTGKESVLGKLQQIIVEYQENYDKMQEADGSEPDSERLVKSLENLNIIVNVFKRLEHIARDDFFNNTLKTAESVFSLMLDFTTTYTYVGIKDYDKEPEHIFIPEEVQTEIKSKLRDITGEDRAPPSLSTEHTSEVLKRYRRKTPPYETFIKYRRQINEKLFRILGEFGTDSVEGVCSKILEIWGGESDSINKNIRMGHFVRDISYILEILMNTRSFLDVFDVFPRTTIQIDQDIELIDLEDASQTATVKEILHKLKKDIITVSLGSNEHANEILTHIGMIKKIYECFSELFIDIAESDKHNDISRLTGINKQVQQEAYINACQSIDSLNSNLQLYFGYLDIKPPAAAGAAGAAGAAES